MSKLEQERQKAIQRYHAGEKVSSICKDLGRNRKWLYKWKNRYDSGDPEWYKDQSRAPNQPAGIDDDLKSMVIEIRKELMQKQYAHIGAQAIHWELRRMGVDPPSIATINRIIKQNNLVESKNIRKRALHILSYQFGFQIHYIKLISGALDI